MNHTQEKGWGKHQPGEQVQILQELEVGKFYLKKSFLNHEDFVVECFNVVEILPIPEDWVPHKEDDIRYGRFVDPNDLSQPRIYSTGLFAIWDWELTNRLAKPDIFYHIKV